MSDLPEEIFLNNAEFKLFDALRQKNITAIGSTKYTRADIAQAREDALRAEIERLWDCLKNVQGCIENDCFFDGLDKLQIEQALAETGKE